MPSATYHSPYGIRTRVTAVKRRCLNPLTNGPELLFSTLTIIQPFYFLSTTFLNFFNFFCIASYRVRISNSLNTMLFSFLSALQQPQFVRYVGTYRPTGYNVDHKLLLSVLNHEPKSKRYKRYKPFFLAHR